MRPTTSRLCWWATSTRTRRSPSPGQYFGRLPRGVKAPVRPRTREMPQLAEKRMVAYAETTPQVAIWYHSVPDGHVDEPAIVVLGQILSGRTGRLYKSLVEEQEVANSASAGQAGYGFEGSFALRGTAKPGKTPEDVEQALYRELEKLQAEPVTDRELQKVKNQNARAQLPEPALQLRLDAGAPRPFSLAELGDH